MSTDDEQHHDDAGDEADTAEQPAAAEEATSEDAASERPRHARGRAGFDRRWGFVAAALLAVALAFWAGAAVAGDDAPRDRFAQRADRAGSTFGGRGPMGGDRRGAYPQQGHGRRGGDGRAGHVVRGAGTGVVTERADDSFAVEPLGGSSDSVTVNVDDDTEFLTRGDAGPRDVEEASYDDIDPGDVVLVRAQPAGAADDEDDAAADGRELDASTVLILHDGE